MNTEPRYLRSDIQIEPLVDSWYAWSHLIPPATAARNLTHRHLRIMDSYIGAPEAHLTATRNPQMRGGPFVSYGPDRLDEMKALRAATVASRQPLMELSRALEELDQMLATSANGGPLAPLYGRVPPPLRGYVELLYDTRDHPSYRLIESLLYRSRYYDCSSQAVMLSVTPGDDRPFVLSTPRLPVADALLLQWPFSDPRLDIVAQLRTTPRSAKWLRDHLALNGTELQALERMLTPEPPPAYRSYDGEGARWRYFGHACILLETRDLTILFDPVLSYTYESDVSRYTYDDLPPHIDYVVVTHNHMDHILFETLLQIRHRVGEFIVPRCAGGSLLDPSLKLCFEQIGLSNVRELGELETVHLPNGSITGVPFFGEHGDLAVTTKLAYVVQLGTVRLMFAADACNVEPALYDHIRQQVGRVDVLFVGMECDGAPMSWLYGPLMLRPVERGVDRARRLSGSDHAQAAALVASLGASDVYVYAMGQEPWLNHVMSIKYTDQSRPIVESERLLAECHAKGMVAERLFGEKEIILDGVFR